MSEPKKIRLKEDLVEPLQEQVDECETALQNMCWAEPLLELRENRIKELEARVKSLFSHEAVNAFWEVWDKVGKPHKHGVYESTWMAFKAAFNAEGKCQIADKNSAWPDND